MTDPLDNVLKCLNNNFVFKKPILCFKSSYEIVLEIGSDVFTAVVGCKIGFVVIFSAVECVSILGNFICMNGWVGSDS